MKLNATITLAEGIKALIDPEVFICGNPRSERGVQLANLWCDNILSPEFLPSLDSLLKTGASFVGYSILWEESIAYKEWMKQCLPIGRTSSKDEFGTYPVKDIVLYQQGFCRRNPSGKISLRDLREVERNPLYICDQYSGLLSNELVECVESFKSNTTFEAVESSSAAKKQFYRLVRPVNINYLSDVTVYSLIMEPGYSPYIKKSGLYFADLSQNTPQIFEDCIGYMTDGQLKLVVIRDKIADRLIKSFPTLPYKPVIDINSQFGKTTSSILFKLKDSIEVSRRRLRAHETESESDF